MNNRQGYDDGALEAIVDALADETRKYVAAVRAECRAEIGKLRTEFEARFADERAVAAMLKRSDPHLKLLVSNG